MNQNNGGTGWAGSWHGWNEGGDAQYELNNSVSLPQGASPFTPVGGHILSNTNVAKVATRILSTPLQTDVTTTYYFSYQFRRDTGLGEAGIAFYNSAGSPATSDLFFGALYDSPNSAESRELRLKTSVGDTRAENALTNGVNYFLVIKLAMNESSTNDNMYANVYSETDTVSDTEPVTWQYSKIGGSITPTTLDTIYLRNSAPAGQSQYLDEFRLGTTWNDVAGASAIPEPSTLALSGLALLLMLRRMWRK